SRRTGGKRVAPLGISMADAVDCGPPHHHRPRYRLTRYRPARRARWRSRHLHDQSSPPGRGGNPVTKQLRENDDADVVAEFFEAVEGRVYRDSLQRNRPDNAMRQIECPRAREFEETWELGRPVIGHADDLGFLVYQLEVRRY